MSNKKNLHYGLMDAIRKGKEKNLTPDEKAFYDKKLEILSKIKEAFLTELEPETKKAWAAKYHQKGDEYYEQGKKGSALQQRITKQTKKVAGRLPRNKRAGEEDKLKKLGGRANMRDYRANKIYSFSDYKKDLGEDSLQEIDHQTVFNYMDKSNKEIKKLAKKDSHWKSPEARKLRNRIKGFQTGTEKVVATKPNKYVKVPASGESKLRTHLQQKRAAANAKRGITEEGAPTNATGPAVQNFDPLLAQEKKKKQKTQIMKRLAAMAYLGLPLPKSK